MPNPERVIAYIDGYNLYNGMKDSGFSRYKWLDLQTLVQSLLKPNQKLICVKYFTTLVTNDVARRLRQKTYVNALSTKELVRIYYGKFQNEKVVCKKCGNDFIDNCEKMTDVNIATQMIVDFYQDNFDMAMIISGDTDLLPPIRFINDSPNKRAFVAFPPDRVNDEVRNAAKGSLSIGRKKLAESQFPEPVVSQEGEAYNKPIEWI